MRSLSPRAAPSNSWVQGDSLAGTAITSDWPASIVASRIAFSLIIGLVVAGVYPVPERFRVGEGEFLLLFFSFSTMMFGLLSAGSMIVTRISVADGIVTMRGIFLSRSFEANRIERILVLFVPLNSQPANASTPRWNGNRISFFAASIVGCVTFYLEGSRPLRTSPIPAQVVSELAALGRPYHEPKRGA